MPKTEAEVEPGPPSPRELERAVEQGLLPPVVVAGVSDPGATVADRMAYYGVPAVSIAVAIDGTIAWAEGYGPGVDADTVFQAASLSKAVAATGIVTVAAREGIDLDADITPHLGEFDLAAVNPAGVDVTLRKLLSHTAGATVQGFPGYAVDDVIPSTLEVIAGSDHTNTDPVTIELEAEHAFRYSGGGFQVAQFVAERAAKQHFTGMMKQLVLEPVGMGSSTFAQPLPSSFVREHEVAKAHNRGPVEVEGGWRVHPEQAAAGLWTTPSDYLRFALAIMAAAGGDTSTGIAPEVARAVLTPVSDDYGLGIGLPVDEQGRRRLQHSGANEGYQCLFVAYPDLGAALVVMTNSDSGFPLALEVSRSAAKAYGWPGDEVREVSPVPLTDAASARAVGSYVFEGTETVAFEITAAHAQRLVGHTTQGIPVTLLHLGDDAFIDSTDGEELRFVIDEPAVVVVDGRGRRFVRQRSP